MAFIQRTSLYFDSRSCPRHQHPIELILDDSREKVSPLYWWCADCRGSWAEEYFYFRVELQLPILALSASFSFPCPRCGSLDISHGCVVGCCDAHGCNACGAGFDLIAKIVEEHHDQLSSPLALYDALERDGATGIGGGGGPLYIEHPFVHPSQYCGRHPRHRLRLSSFPEISDERLRFGWSCSACPMFYFDYRLYRTQRTIFVPSGRPEVECPACGNTLFDSLRNLDHARCISCGSIIHLYAERVT